MAVSTSRMSRRPAPAAGPTLSPGLDPTAFGLGGVSRRRSDRAVERFWAWWREGGARAAAEAVRSGDTSSVVPEITSLVEDVDPGLAWEFGPGRDGAAHTLTVTAAGVPELRGAARRWLAGAPEDDPVWAFADLREPVTGQAMVFRGRRFGFDEASVTVDVGLTVAHVTVFHPLLADLGEADRGLTAYLLLDAVVGEAAVETWVGRIAADAGPPPAGAMPLTAMPDVLDRLVADNTDAEGAPAWHILHGPGDGGPMVAMARSPLVALSAPEFDRHVAVCVPYTDVEDHGLPGPSSLPGLRDLEDHLTGRVRGSAECVGAESCAGLRTLHFYADSAAPVAEQLRTAAAGWSQGPVQISESDDPGWSQVQHLRV